MSLIVLRHMMRQCRIHSLNVSQKLRVQLAPSSAVLHTRGKHSSNINNSSLFVPVPIKKLNNEINVGAELVGKLDKKKVDGILTKYFQKEITRLLANENGLDDYIYRQAHTSFHRFCVREASLPTDLHVFLSDALKGSAHIDGLFPYFLDHARQIFPHLNCLDTLKKISDLSVPADWYPEARAVNRKFIFHSGPTNSGKTYHALERFLSANSAVYCGPLKMLANEVFQKSNERGTPCDLVTGEERRFGKPDGSASTHVASTVEMTVLNTQYEVAVIDEIQMLRDPQRGWAWTRALLGVAAEEIHLCGEVAAIDLVKNLLVTTGEEVEVRKYERLTELEIESSALGSLDSVQPGDCIVCFSKHDIYTVSRQIERLGHEVAVIYGGLPPGTKLAQAQKFNDPDNPCKIMVATDAIGMGLNLSIRRVVFYSLIKPTLNEQGEKEIQNISTSQALQIAGRAGRYGTQFSKGSVTTFRADDLPTLKEILAQPVEPLHKAGLHPTADQIELYAYHLPETTLSNLMDIFVSLSTVDDSLYFMCNTADFKFLADSIQHIGLPLRARYVFCCAPINKKMPFVCNAFINFATMYGRNKPITHLWMKQLLKWPFKVPHVIADLVHLEGVFDILDLYLWFSYRFVDIFPDGDEVRIMQRELDDVINEGVLNITSMLKETDSEISNNRIEVPLADYDDHPPRLSSFRDISMGPVGRSQRQARGRLADRLIDQGVLTPKLLESLQLEWKHSNDNQKSHRNSQKHGSKSGHNRRRN